jgi:hypothetical protein
MEKIVFGFSPANIRELHYFTKSMLEIGFLVSTRPFFDPESLSSLTDRQLAPNEVGVLLWSQAAAETEHTNCATQWAIQAWTHGQLKLVLLTMPLYLLD